MGDDAPAQRRDEDRAACDRLGCYLIHLPFADAVYRVEPVTQRICMIPKKRSSARCAMRTSSIGWPWAVEARLRQVTNARLVVPLTAGQHVDHVITRVAAEHLNAELIYYEDYPYAEQPERMMHVWGRADGVADEWVSESIGLSEDALVAKIEAFLQHRSQISTFYRDDEEVRQRMRAYAEFVGQGRPAERYWRKL